MYFHIRTHTNWHLCFLWNYPPSAETPMLCVYHVTSLSHQITPLPIKEWRLWALEPCIVKKIWNMDSKAWGLILWAGKTQKHGKWGWHSGSAIFCHEYRASHRDGKKREVEFERSREELYVVSSSFSFSKSNFRYSNIFAIPFPLFWLMLCWVDFWWSEMLLCTSTIGQSSEQLDGLGTIPRAVVSSVWSSWRGSL